MRHKKTTSPEAEARKVKLQELAARLNDLTEQQRQEWLSRLGIVVRCEDGSPLSINNSILLWYQDERITMVGGYRQWLAKGRQVRKGAKSYAVFAPTGKKSDQTSMDIKDQQPIRFRLVSVFDVSQTDEVTTDSTEEIESESEYVN